MQEIESFEALRSKKAGVVSTHEYRHNTFQYNTVLHKD